MSDRSRGGSSTDSVAQNVSIESERLFIAENGRVAETCEEQDPVMDSTDRVEGTDDRHYDTVVFTEEIGSRNAMTTGTPSRNRTSFAGWWSRWRITEPVRSTA